MIEHVKRRVIFLSSRDRIGYPAGDAYDFFVDLENSVSQLGPEFDTRDPNVKVTMSVSQLFFSLDRGNYGKMDRDPPYVKGSVSRGTRHVPQVQLLRVHTNVLHENMVSTGHSNVVLQIPLMEHYKEATREVDYTFSHVAYQEPHADHVGRFELSGGLESLNFMRFWLTDEGDRLVVPRRNSEVYLALTLEATSNRRLHQHRNDVGKGVRELIHLNRLLLVQGDSREAVREHLSQRPGSPPARVKRNRRT